MDETTRSILVGTATDGRLYILLIVFVFNWIMGIAAAYKVGQFHAGLLMEFFINDVMIRGGGWYVFSVVMAWVTAFTPNDGNKLIQEVVNTGFPFGSWAGLITESFLKIQHKAKVLQGDPEAIRNTRAKVRAKYFEQSTGVT